MFFRVLFQYLLRYVTQAIVSPSGVNFINVLLTHFLYKSTSHSFSLVTVWLWKIFGAKILAQNLRIKCWWKKSTPGQIDLQLAKIAFLQNKYFCSMLLFVLWKVRHLQSRNLTESYSTSQTLSDAYTISNDERHVTSAVNFINLLHACFLYKILAPKITKLCL